MREVLIGEAIRQRRLEMGLTQEKLCEGICDPVSISRIETGKQAPSRKKLKALLNRLGMSGDLYYAIMSKNETEITLLREKIICCYDNGEFLQGLAYLNQLRQIAEPEDKTVWQFILLLQSMMGQVKDGELCPYSFQEKKQLLKKAIGLTLPYFDIAKVSSGLYGIGEMAVLTQYAQALSDHGESGRALKLYEELFSCLKRRFDNILNSDGMLPLLACCYAKELDKNGDFKRAQEMIDLGWESCVRYESYDYLPAILIVMAKICFHMGQPEESLGCFYQMYYLYEAIGETRHMERVKQEAKDILGIELSVS